MNRFKLLGLSTGVVLALSVGIPAMAQHQHGAADHAASHPNGGLASSGQMVDGEVRKVDRAAKRVTIRHGEIKNLGMPPMTMVFQVRDPALLAKANEGDNVRFRAESNAGALVLTALEVIK